MTDGKGSLDYELAERMELTTIREVKAVAEPLRESLLELLLDRSATVTELATAVGRPKGTVAYHVKVLASAGLVRAVRTRQVRAVTEIYYGRTARLFFVGALKALDESGRPLHSHYLAIAAAESAQAHAEDTLTSIMRHASIPREHLREFRQRIFDLADEFSRLPRGGTQVYGFIAGLYPTEHPQLPDPTESEPPEEPR